MTDVTVYAAPNLSVNLSASGPQGALGVGVPSGGSVDDLIVRTASGTEWTSSPVVDLLGFDTTASGNITTGEMTWNADEGTVALGKNGISHYIGQDTVILCRNNSNTTSIAKGTALMFAGTVGNSGRLKVSPMVANGSFPGYVFFGVATQNIAPASDGYVTTFGKIRGINTSAYQEGAILWCHPSTPGQFTETEPTAPSLKLPVAAVISAANNGAIFVRWATGSRLQDLHDVDANGNKADKDVLSWNASSARWEASDRLTLLEARVTALET